MPELLAGCGSSREKQIDYYGKGWNKLTTLDNNPDHHPDILYDLTVLPWFFLDDTFDEVHMYQVLEHLGQQGDYVTFFAQFSEIWRILKPNGLFCATVPALTSPWLWGDPSHTRVIAPETLTFLSQRQYETQVGKTSISDFRYLYEADFELMESFIDDENFAFVLKALKS